MDAKELDALKRLIVDYIEDRDYVSFPQLERHGAQAGYAMEGTAALELGGKNVVVWMGMSQAFCDAIRELLDEKTIFLCPTTSLTYLADGKILILPIAKRPPANGYTKPHWCPAVMRIVPF